MKKDQYNDKYLKNVIRKGKARNNIYVSLDCRKHLEEYFKTERKGDDPDDTAEPLLLPVKTHKHLTRDRVSKVLVKIADEANKHCKDESMKIKLHPHRLRHTFGAEYRERTGSDTETAAILGHSGLKYVGRYVRKTKEERETTLDGFSIDGE